MPKKDRIKINFEGSLIVTRRKGYKLIDRLKKMIKNYDYAKKGVFHHTLEQGW